MNRISNYLSAQGIVPFMASWKLLDTRPEGLYRTLHLVGAVSLPVPGTHWDSELLEKYLPSILLPARHEPLLVMVESEARGDAVIQFFKGRGGTKHIPSFFLKTCCGPCRQAFWPMGPKKTICGLHLNI